MRTTSDFPRRPCGGQFCDDTAATQRREIRFKEQHLDFQRGEGCDRGGRVKYGSKKTPRRQIRRVLFNSLSDINCFFLQTSIFPRSFHLDVQLLFFFYSSFFLCTPLIKELVLVNMK